VADPLTAFFAWAGTTVGGTSGAFMIMYATELAYATIVVASVSAGRTMKRRAEAKARQAFNDSLQDRSIVVTSGSEPSAFVYGRAKVGGVLVHAQSTGDLGQYLHLVIAHVRHECDAIEAIYFNDEELPPENPSTGFVESGTFAKVVTKDKVDFVTTNGSGVATLTRTASKVDGVGIPVSSPENDTPFTPTYTFVAPSNQVTGLPPNTQVVVSYEYEQVTPLVRIIKHLGEAGQVADATLISESGGEWTSNDVGVNVTYTYIRIEYNHDIFGSIGIPKISARLRGFKVYDPRTTQTVWSRNAALCTAHYVLNTPFGLRCDASELVYSEITPQANICDEEIPVYNVATCDVTNGSPTVKINNTSWHRKVRPGMIFIGPNSVRYEIKDVVNTNNTSSGWRITLVSNYGGTTALAASYSIVQRRYECNGTLGSDVSSWENLNALLDTMAGDAVYVQGRWVITAGAYPSIAMQIDETMLADDSIRIIPHRGFREVFNGVRGQYFNRFEQYVQVDYPPVTSTTYQNEDGGERILANVNYGLVDNFVQAQRLSKIELLRSRQDLTIELTTNLRAYDLRPGSVVELSLAAFGFVLKPFQVLSREYGFAGRAKYILQETAPEIYQWDFNEAKEDDPAPNTTLPRPGELLRL
jgi:hypothetical protein